MRRSNTSVIGWVYKVMGAVRVSIVTVCHRSSRKLGEYVRSLVDIGASRQAWSEVEFVFVENSGDRQISAVIEPLRALGSSVKLYFTPNSGFGAGCNFGVRQATGEVVIFANPDVIFCSDVSAFRFPDDRVWGTCLQVGGDGHRHSFDIYPEFKWTAVELFGLYKWADFLYCIGLWRTVYVVGAFFAVRRSEFNSIGGFDERFFMYYEEVELSRRLKMRYGKPHLDNQCRVFHSGFGSETTREFTIITSAESFVRYALICGVPEIVPRRMRTLWCLGLFSSRARLARRHIAKVWGQVGAD